MPRIVPSSLAEVINRLIASGAWIALIQIERNPTGYYRLARSSRHVVAGGFTWGAAAATFEAPEESIDGGHGELVVGVPNVSRIPLGLVENENQLRGRELTLWLHHTSLTELVPDLSIRQVITKVNATEGMLKATCGHAADGLFVPWPVYDRVEFPQLQGSWF
ncbi:MAG: hypothetical protein IT435_16115 [Phycisphaerales bacterium]|nr:hypothetical protein [Phycisphaerales bacterium]